MYSWDDSRFCWGCVGTGDQRDEVRQFITGACEECGGAGRVPVVNLTKPDQEVPNWNDDTMILEPVNDSAK